MFRLAVYPALCGLIAVDLLSVTHALAGQDSSASPRFVSTESELAVVEETVIGIRPVDLAGLDLQLADGDDAAEAFFKVRALCQLYGYQKVIKDRFDGERNLNQEFLATSTAAHDKWPQAAELAVMHAYALLYGNGPIDALDAIAPWVPETKRVPGVAIVLHRIFYTIDLNLKRGHAPPEKCVLVSRGIPAAEVKVAAEDLAVLWWSHVDNDQAGRLANVGPAYRYSAKGVDLEEQNIRAFKSWQVVLQLSLAARQIEDPEEGVATQ